MKVRKSTKKQNPSPPDLIALAERIVSCPETELPSVLKSFDRWVYPRSDLHAWVNVLDRFDDILAEITKTYGLSKIQTNDFTPKTKELLLEILRLTCQRLCDLLLTSDLDVLYSTIFVLLRPSQQYANQTPFDSAQRHAALHRLLTLSRGWERLTSSGTDLTTLATTQVDLPADLTEVSIQYYPSSEPSSSSTPPSTETPRRPARLAGASSTETPRRPARLAQGASTLDLGNVTTWSNSADQLTSQAEAAQVPLDDQYVALNKIRLARAVTDLDVRRQLLSVRLLALATYVYISNEDAAQSGLFLYEPDLVPQIADLIRAAPSDEIVTGALLAFDACAHHRAKTTEVMTAVSANVNHGILISFLRHMVDRMVQGGLSNFSGVDGVNILVTRVKIEIERRLAASDATPTETLSEETILANANNPLRGVLRPLQRLMQASGGTEGLRNLVDSDLPKSLRRIFETPAKFGTRVFALGKSN
ncbi:hypothetical protein IAT40_001985 [Kwoniella sp. CBS 6097]